jgi:Holliday junction resolvase
MQCFHFDFLLSVISSYSWSKFGREAEFIIAIYLKLRGWSIQLSKGSRGPADIIATRNSTVWLIQVKSSNTVPKLKGYDLKRLKEMADIFGGLAVIAILRPAFGGNPNKDSMSLEADERLYEINLGRYSIFFYSLDNWKAITPSQY